MTPVLADLAPSRAVRAGLALPLLALVTLVACSPAPQSRAPAYRRAGAAGTVAEPPVAASSGVPRTAPSAASALAVCAPSPAALAALSCDGGEIVLAHAVDLRPEAPAPTGDTLATLEAVAQLLATHPEVLLVRVEAYLRPSSRQPEGEALRATQARADAVLLWLWRHGGVSAERLESVGYGDRGPPSGSARFRIALRVLQTAPASALQPLRGPTSSTHKRDR